MIGYIHDTIEDHLIDLGSFYLSVSLIPPAYKMNDNMKRAGYYKELKKPAVFDISFDTVEDVFRQINEKENVEDLFNRVFEQREH